MGSMTARKSPAVPAFSDFDDGLSSAERTMRTAIMLALDEVPDLVASTYADRNIRKPQSQREWSTRQMADLIMRSAVKRVDVRLKPVHSIRVVK